MLGPVTNTRLLEPPVLKAESEAKQRRLESQGAYIQKLVEERGQREAELSEARTGAELQAQRIVHLQQVRFMCTKISLNATEGQASCLIAACFCTVSCIVCGIQCVTQRGRRCRAAQKRRSSSVH